MENEDLKLFDVKGYEGIYKINKNGDVYSLPRKVPFREYEMFIKGKKKKHTKLKTGYYAVGLWKNNVQKLIPIHRLIAETFIPNPKKLKCINHIDGNKENNNIGNLEWCTHSENVKHAYDTGLCKKGKKVMCIETGIVYKSESEAAKAMNQKNGQPFIGAVARGERKTAYGYHWKFI